MEKKKKFEKVILSSSNFCSPLYSFWPVRRQVKDNCSNRKKVAISPQFHLLEKFTHLKTQNKTIKTLKTKCKLIVHAGNFNWNIHFSHYNNFTKEEIVEGRVKMPCLSRYIQNSQFGRFIYLSKGRSTWRGWRRFRFKIKVQFGYCRITYRRQSNLPKQQSRSLFLSSCKIKGN